MSFCKNISTVAQNGIVGQKKMFEKENSILSDFVQHKNFKI